LNHAPDSFRELLLESLAPLAGLRCKAMFGGHGLYCAGAFFGILHRGKVYFKTNEATRRRYVEAGMGPFRPSPRQTLRSYYEVPASVIDKGGELLEWARESARVAVGSGAEG
jgi:DNA transformation protein